MFSLKGNVKEKSQLIDWFTFAPGFELQLRYLTRQELLVRDKEVEKEALKLQETTRRGEDLETLKGEVGRAHYAKNFIRDWRMSLDFLRDHFDIDDYPTDPIAYTPENGEMALLHVYGLEFWLVRKVVDLAGFREGQRRAQLGNSPAAPSGSFNSRHPVATPPVANALQNSNEEN